MVDRARLVKWHGSFFADTILDSGLATPAVSEALERAVFGLTFGQDALIKVVGTPKEAFDREVHHHGALLFRSWEGFRHGLLGVTLASHGDYAAADMVTRLIVEMALTGACMDRLVHAITQRESVPLNDAFSRIGAGLRKWASDKGRSLRVLEAESDLATIAVGELWDREVRFEDLLRQADLFGLLTPLGYGKFRNYVRYDVLSGTAHASPIRTEVYYRMVEGVGHPFDLEPVFIPAVAAEVLNRLQRCADGVLLLSLNTLAACLVTREEPREALHALDESLSAQPDVVPHAHQAIRSLLASTPESKGD